MKPLLFWRVGGKVPLNVYDGDDNPVCQCHTPEHAAHIVQAVNLLLWMEWTSPETLKAWRDVRAAQDMRR